ncbi:uncharacterized protein LOC123317283 isoform X2 [Coccinella septempunctata]|uniref:uncharacterized protein LOC123317283 isoform X2 n=1 Tax=Coccinella septempunctata TaxID=41139 RepID=UPI001D097FC9|nr:uncharacterized protein LOC123317283 isoform X2 [Coccinella septempunctata]
MVNTSDEDSTEENEECRGVDVSALMKCEMERSKSAYKDIIIEQKDILINELADKIGLLKKHINLLEKLDSSIPANPSFNEKNKGNNPTSEIVYKSASSSGSSDVTITYVDDGNTDVIDGGTKVQSTMSSERTIDRQKVKDNWTIVERKKKKNRSFTSSHNSFNNASGMVGTVGDMKVDNHNIKTNNKNMHNNKVSQSYRWNIIGASTDNPIKAVGKKMSLFVSRIAPNTKEEEFEKMCRRQLEHGLPHRRWSSVNHLKRGFHTT